MTAAISDALNSARADAARALLDGSSGLPGRIALYAGTKPEPGAAAGSPLAIVTLSRPCGTASPDGLLFTIPTPALAISAGTITWARFEDSDGEWFIDCDVAQDDGEGGPSAAEIILDRISVYTGATITLTRIEFVEQ